MSDIYLLLAISTIGAILFFAFTFFFVRKRKQGMLTYIVLAAIQFLYLAYSFYCVENTDFHSSDAMGNGLMIGYTFLFILAGQVIISLICIITALVKFFQKKK